jgi:hypothetical protein
MTLARISAFASNAGDFFSAPFNHSVKYLNLGKSVFEVAMALKESAPRVSSRDQTKITGTVTCKTESTNGIVKDLSDQGICFQLLFDIGARAGQEVTIESEELGHLTGMVRWCRGDRIGVKLNLSSNTAAQISSYYKFFSQVDGHPV